MTQAALTKSASRMASLDMTLKDHVLMSDRSMLVAKLWGPRPTSQHELLEEEGQLDTFFETYFKYYAEQCDIGRHANGKYSSVETHSDIMDIAHLLQQPLSREEVRNQMSDFLRAADDEQHDNSINLVARLLLMIKFGDLPHEFLGGRSVKWSSGTLSEFIHGYFSRPQAYRLPVYISQASTPQTFTLQACTHGHIKLQKQFNALNLQRIAGIRISWTDNLADHLRMMDDDKTVAVFYHASFLEYQKHNPMFPAGFIEETLRTLAILFPKHDAATKKWYMKAALNSACRFDMQLLRIKNVDAESRQMENFGYWHDRLVILKEVYDEHRPSTLYKWWYDRRNGVQWYTFWVALLVLILTIIQCVEGAIQAVVALKQ